MAAARVHHETPGLVAQRQRLSAVAAARPLVAAAVSPLARLLGAIHVLYGTQRAVGMRWETYRFEEVLRVDGVYQCVFGGLELCLGVMLCVGVDTVNALALAAMLNVVLLIAASGVDPSLNQRVLSTDVRLADANRRVGEEMMVSAHAAAWILLHGLAAYLQLRVDRNRPVPSTAAHTMRR